HTPTTTSSALLSLHDALPICLELRALEDVGDVDELQLGAQVRLVGAVLQHGLAERDPRERGRHVTAVAELLEQLGHQLLDGLERSEEHTSELQSRENIVCRLL